MDKIGKIIVQEKEYDLAWNGGVKVRTKCPEKIII